jgi:methylated-DNA-[protein]-cysteine S-methyltransferase
VKLFIDRIASSIGTILLVSDGKHLCALDYAGYEHRMMKLLQARYEQVVLQEAADPCGFSNVLRRYLAGDLACIGHISINTGGTSFQQQVWSALRKIPPGSVMTYGEMAVQLGKPPAYRAVGMTNALNPIAIVVPCHRLVGSNGALTGYAGGLDRKKWLLEHEGVNCERLTT